MSIDQSNIRGIKDAFLKIGYKSGFIQSNYSYSDFYADLNPINRTVDLAVFGQEPFDYRSACFGIKFLPFANGQDFDIVIAQLRALGAPQIFIVLSDSVQRWKNHEKRPELIEQFKPQELPGVIKKNIAHWNPENIIRLKTGFQKPVNQQIDFVDIGLLAALEREASIKLDDLIKRLLHTTHIQYHNQKTGFEPNEMFQVIFRFLTGKLLKDRNITINLPSNFSDDPVGVLNIVSKYYSVSRRIGITKIPRNLLEVIASQVDLAFSFNNLSVDTLTYVYENTFVSEDTRKTFGIHSTPSYVADYILSLIPIENIDQKKWNAFDPMCGHGIFLVAAMRRFRDLLSKDWNGRKRHEFFSKHLSGVEIDSFAIEVARMCLTLADFPESNGWNIVHSDIFKGNLLEEKSSTATIFVGNPPFENIKVKVPQTPKPAELLNRALTALPQDAFIGLVLPRSFLDGSDYKRQRELIEKQCELLSLTTLPDKIFPYSDAETAILIAQKKNKPEFHSVVYREVRDNDKEMFRLNTSVTWEDTVESNYFKNNSGGRFIVPFLRELWEYLTELPTLGDIAEIKVGVAYEPSLVCNRLHEIIIDQPRRGFVPAIIKVTKGFQQYAASDIRYISTDEKFWRKRARGAWKLDWSKPKVVIPAGRMSRGPWRFAGAIDKEGRYVTRDFFSIWPRETTWSVELIAALINSPIAAAFAYSFSSQRGIPKRVYEQIPIPKNLLNIKSTIDHLVNEYLNLPREDEKAMHQTLLRIDAQILNQYLLPPKLERKLIDIFYGAKRPVSVDFTGYFPSHFKSWIPLSKYISDEYQNSSVKKIVSGFPSINNHAIIQFLKNVGQE